MGGGGSTALETRIRAPTDSPSAGREKGTTGEVNGANQYIYIIWNPLVTGKIPGTPSPRLGVNYMKGEFLERDTYTTY